MKAPAAKSSDSRENEALQWAIGFFRENADGRGEEQLEDTISTWYQYMTRSGPKKLDLLEDIAIQIDGAHEGEKDSILFLCWLAAAFIEDAKPLPAPLQSFVVEFLRNPKMEAKHRGPEAGKLVGRNMQVAEAIEHIVKTWQFPATRNTAAKRASAASIVKEALAMSAGIHLSEAAVNKIWNRSFIKSWSEELAAIK